MKVSDYIVQFLIDKGIMDVFGYPGGMVTPLMDSFALYQDQISAHVTYHEQGAAFAACGYAQTSGKPGVAYATSGPGATNLITGIANAFFDSIPCIFITGQVNSYEAKGEYGVRQRGFQETDIVSIVKPLTKYAVKVDSAEDTPSILEKAYKISMSGRKGPVLLDIPMNVFRTEIEVDVVNDTSFMLDSKDESREQNISAIIRDALNKSSYPVIIVGNGVKSASAEGVLREELSRMNIPIVSSMIAFDVMNEYPLYYGFLGAYGSRTANFIVAKSDLIITIGTRMDIRQVGANREGFAPDARIIRFDIDPGELDYKVHKNETQLVADVHEVARAFESIKTPDFSPWIAVCDQIKSLLADKDSNRISYMMEEISNKIPDGVVITTDVGQNQVWVAQSFKVKPCQRVLFSGGHGAMGYSLPAAIGAYYGSGKKPVYCITGDGGMQMNIQELQFIARERLPIKIIVLNNNALGMIRHFQELYYDSRFFQTKPEGGYTSPDFERIAVAYGITSHSYEVNDFISLKCSDEPELCQIMIREDTYVIPKLEYGKPNQDQEPLIDRELYRRIMEMKVKINESMFGGGVLPK